MIRTLSCLCLAASLLGSCKNDAKQSENEPVHADSILVSAPDLRFLTEKIAETPSNPVLYMNRSRILAQLGEFSLAIGDLRQAQSVAPDDFRAFRILSDLYMEAIYPELGLPNSRMALEIVEDFVKEFPDNDDAILKLAEIQRNLKMYDESNASLRNLIGREVFESRAWFLLSSNLRYQGDTATAITALERALEYNPDYYEAHYELGYLHGLFRREIALAYFDNAIRLRPEDIDAYYAKGMLEQRLGRLNAAKTTYRRLIRINKQHAKTFYNIGYICYLQDSLDKAASHFAIATNVDPTYADAWFNRGLMEEELGKISKAADYYRQALRLAPEHALALEGLQRLLQASEAS